MEPPKELKNVPLERPKPKEQERKPDFEALVVLGKNWRGDAVNPRLPAFRALSIESRIGAMAAGILYEKGSIGKIIFSGGATRKGLPSEAKAMAEYLRKRYPNIPEEAVVLEEESRYTAENAEKTAQILNQHGIKEAAVMTYGYHTRRAEDRFKKLGLDVQQVFSSEEIAQERSPHVRSLLEKFAKSGHVKVVERLREGFFKAASLVGAGKGIERFCALRVGKR